MTIRLNKVTRDLNVGIATVVEFLQKKGYTVEANPNTKISEEQYAVLVKEFSTDKNLRLESERFIQERQNKERNKASVSIEGFEKQQEKPKQQNPLEISRKSTRSGPFPAGCFFYLVAFLLDLAPPLAFLGGIPSKESSNWA